MTDLSTTTRDVSPAEFTWLRELASALDRPRLAAGWAKSLQSTGQVLIPRSLYAAVSPRVQHEVDVVINDLPFACTGDDNGLTLSFNQPA